MIFARGLVALQKSGVVIGMLPLAALVSRAPAHVWPEVGDVLMGWLDGVMGGKGDKRRARFR